MNDHGADKNGTKDRAELYLFFGDEFLAKEQVQKLFHEIVAPETRETNFVVFDGNNLDVSQLSSELFTPSLFGGNRLIVVDQTTIFMGKADQTKLVAKVLSSWKAGDRKASLKAFGQLLALAGLGALDVKGGSQWVDEVLGDNPTAEEREILSAVSIAFLEDGKQIRSIKDEDTIADLVLSPFPEGTVLVFTAPDVDKRKKLFKAVSNRGHVVECAVRQEKYGAGLDRSFFDKRVRDTLKRAGKEITPEALDKIYSRSGKEIRRLDSELNKLVGYLGDKPKLTAEDVETLFSDFHEAAFFDLSSALRTADITRCLPALHDNLKLVSHPLQTLGAIASEFRKLILARELLFTVFKPYWKRSMSYDRFVAVAAKVRENHPELNRKGKYALLSMKDYPLLLLLKDAQKFPMEKLIRIMEAVVQADISMKSSKVGNKLPEAVLENLVFEVCSPQRGPLRGPVEAQLHR